MNRDTVGGRVHSLRTERKWSQMRLAAEATQVGIGRVTQNAVSRVETGQQTAADNLVAMAMALGVPTILLYAAVVPREEFDMHREAIGSAGVGDPLARAYVAMGLACLDRRIGLGESG